MADALMGEGRAERGDEVRPQPPQQPDSAAADERARIDEYRYGAPREHHFLRSSGTINDPAVLR